MRKLIKVIRPGSKLKPKIVEVPNSTYVSTNKNRRLIKKENSNSHLMLDTPNSPALNYYINFVNQHEGQSITNTKGDKGGLTNNGITLNTWKTLGWDKNNDGTINEQDLRLITPKDHEYILKTGFWNKSRADSINNPKVAAYVTDYVWGSGDLAYKLMHQAFNLNPKLEMSEELLNELNNNPDSLDILHNSRTNFYKQIVRRDPSQRKFLKGWLNRANDLYNANDI